MGVSPTGPSSMNIKDQLTQDCCNQMKTRDINKNLGYCCPFLPLHFPPFAILVLTTYISLNSLYVGVDTSPAGV